MQKRIRPFNYRHLLLINSITLLFTLSLKAQDNRMEERLASFARYGADVWARNPVALIPGEGKACISCHTSLSYALVEPLIKGEYKAYDNLIENVHNRILTWDQNTPWYTHDKTADMAELAGRPKEPILSLIPENSRGSEAVLNVLISTTHDSYQNKSPGKETQLAFDHLWKEQINQGDKEGLWRWIQVNLIPWESYDSDVWGAALAGVASAIYPDLSPTDNLHKLQESLKKYFYKEDISLHAKAAIFWYNAESQTTFLNKDSVISFAEELLSLQRKDGGWNLRQLGPWTNWEGTWRDCCPNRELRSDAYATGFITTVLACSPDYLPSGGLESLENSITWIQGELSNPYPDGPRYNTHRSGPEFLPELRENLYMNNGHMWSYIAIKSFQVHKSPWKTSGL